MARPAVAILADAHFHDTFADFGAGILIGGQRRALRSWPDTATGARAVNESGDALQAALAAVRARGIRHVVLLGDYTDDGQVTTTARLAALLHDQTARHGLRFYAIPGNHDVWGPCGKHTATRLATAPDRTVLVTSDAALAATEPDAVLSPGLRCAGQPQGLGPMAAFGLFRQPEYLHWETPFGASDDPAARMYHAVSADGSVTQRLMDASYLVEPEVGLWLLMIDANVFEPRNGIADPARKRAFHDPSTAGWNAVLRVKPFLLGWIADVVRRAGAQGKHMLALSHYPALDPFEDDGSEGLLFGASEVARRTPGSQVGARLAQAGVDLHFSGHIHASATTRRGGLTNVAVPSLTAWPPGFAVVAPSGGVETVSLAGVPLDTDLQAFYRDAAAGGGVRDAVDFGSFLLAQSRARTLAHHIPRGFPDALAPAILRATAADLLHLLVGATARLGDSADAGAAIQWCAENGFALPDLQAVVLSDLVADWYAIRQAGALAKGAVPEARLRLVRLLISSFADPQAMPGTDRGFLARWLSMFDRALRRMDEG